MKIFKKTLSVISAFAMLASMTPSQAAVSQYEKITIPITKHVTSLTDVEPGAATFDFEILDLPGSTQYDMVNSTVSTNGTGDFEGQIEISVPTESDHFNFSEGFILRENPEGIEGWIKDRTEWRVMPQMDPAGQFTGYTYYKVGYGDPLDEDTPTFDTIEFTNTYEGEPKPGDAVPPTDTDPTVGKDPTTDPTVGKDPTGAKPDDDPFGIETDDPEGPYVDGKMPTGTTTNEYTLSIPITKIVKKETSIDPAKKTFYFVPDWDDTNQVTWEKVMANSYKIETDGAGTYEGEYVMTPLSEETYKQLMGGFILSEFQETVDGWTYDAAKWFIQPEEIGGKIFFKCYSSESGNADEYLNRATFTNTFSTATKPDDKPETKPATPPTEESKVVTHPSDPDLKVEVPAGSEALVYEGNGGLVYNAIEVYPKGTKVDLTKIATRDGYTFLGWFSDAETTTPVTSVELNDTTIVYAGWEKTPVPEMLNGDTHSYYVLGYEDGTVRPEANITRAEVTMIFFRLLKPDVREANKTTKNSFTDVPVSEWYGEAVSTMAKLGIIKGRTATTFEPDASITRAEYAAICARFDKSVVSGTSEFTDIAGHWAAADINRAVKLGWIKGYADNTFRPDIEITRAESMTLTNRVLQRIPETPADLIVGMTEFPDCKITDWYYMYVQEASNSHEYERKENGYEKWTALK